MKILLLDLGKNMRGGQRQVLYLARHLFAERGFSPVLVTPEGAPLAQAAKAEGIPTQSIPSGSDLNPLNILAFFRTLKALRPRIVHTNDAKGASIAALAKKLGIPFRLVHTRRVSYRLKSGWSKAKYLAGDAIVGVSREIRDILVESGIPADKAHAVHSGIDPSLYTTDKTPSSRNVIGSIGALTTQKGHCVLINALGHMKDLPNWKCVLVGEGKLREELEAQAARLGVRERIDFTGYRDSREMLPQMGILCAPSVDGEGSSGVVKEAWVSGTPLVASDLTANLELVEDGKDGLLFRSGDAKALANTLQNLMSCDQLQSTLRENGLSKAKTVTDRVMAESYFRIYRSL